MNPIASAKSVARLLPWVPLIAVGFHLIEEFVWPGGFGEWYRRVYPERGASLTPRFLVWINILLVVMSLGAALMRTSQNGIRLWLIVASIAAANGVFHILATIRSREYSPGVVTGTLLYLPLAVWGYFYFLSNDLVRADVAVQLAIIGPAYHLFSAWNHRRRSRDMGKT
jgi:hypothetical protein